MVTNYKTQPSKCGYKVSNNSSLQIYSLNFKKSEIITTQTTAKGRKKKCDPTIRLKYSSSNLLRRLEEEDWSDHEILIDCSYNDIEKYDFEITKYRNFAKFGY